MVVQGKLRYKGHDDWAPFRMTRKEFISMIEHPGFVKDTEALVVDVCLTRWIYDAVYGWWHEPKAKYVPGTGMVKLTDDERHAKLVRSPNGFTQR